MNTPGGQAGRLPRCTEGLTEAPSGCRNLAFRPHPRLCPRVAPAQGGYLFQFTQIYHTGGKKPRWGHPAQGGPQSRVHVCCGQALGRHYHSQPGPEGPPGGPPPHPGQSRPGWCSGKAGRPRSQTQQLSDLGPGWPWTSHLPNLSHLSLISCGNKADTLAWLRVSLQYKVATQVLLVITTACPGRPQEARPLPLPL